MSIKGRLHRGAKWYSLRGQDSELPKEVLNDTNKMLDVNFYLEEKKKREEPVEEVKETKSVRKK